MKRTMNRDELTNALNVFAAWYKRSGHWLYPTIEDAFAKWTKDGIDGLPQAPKGAVVTTMSK